MGLDNILPVLKEIKQNPDFRKKADETLNYFFDSIKELKDFSWKIDVIKDVELARLEVYSKDFFCSTKYIDENLLIFCIISFFSIFGLNESLARIYWISNEEFFKYPAKGLVYGIDTVANRILEKGGVGENN